ncbi:MAG: hypothetical protein BZY88_00105 [SAR202 cluster bacterium Io17-Chloro-G9]|nr:MAG: hypothetical protein BZY88_00105 [SAR202 cluster bacterium Io17-Chloro-G9]
MDDVIVVGAGPAGNNTALELASLGHSVTVIDWRQDIGDKVCTGIIGQECSRRFPVDPAWVYREASSAQLIAPSSDPVQFQAPATQAKIINRVAYVASFAHRAQAAGAKYLLGQRVSQVKTDLDRITVVTGQGSYQARALVLAAGFGSHLPQQLGFGPVPDHVAGVQAVVETHGVDQVEVQLGSKVAPGFFSWLVPTSPDRALVGLLARRRPQEFLSRLIEQEISRGRIVEVVKEPISWGVPLRPLKRTYSDRVVVVGDSAGQVKPTTGGGIFYSLMAGEIAAQVVSAGLESGDLSGSKFSEYQTRWKDLLARELEIGYSARRLYECLTDNQIGVLVKQAVTAGVPADLSSAEDFSFDWHSHTISRVMGHPVLGRALRLINPILARFTPKSDDGFDPEYPEEVQMEPTADKVAGAPN